MCALIIQQYIHERPKYEANQRIRNKELADMLSEKEGDSVLLYEVSDEEEEFRRPSRYRGSDGPLNVSVELLIICQSGEWIEGTFWKGCSLDHFIFVL